jgi:exopolyphosphatase/pppGpp-phosphohydrolase
MGYAGAVAMMKGEPGKYATLDLGGGSFQLAVGTEKGIEAGGSTQIGSNLIVDTMLAPAARADGVGDPAIFDVVDARLLKEAALPLDAGLLRGRTLVATGGVSKFLRAHFGRDTISRAEIDALRRQVLVMPYAERAALVQTTAAGAPKDDDTKRALGVDTVEGAIDFGKKLPASASLMLRILDGLGVDSIRVSETDARHALIARAVVS